MRNSIVITKGFAIICILIANTLNYWLYYANEFIFPLSYLLILLEIFGASLYIFLFSFSFVFTLKKKLGCIPEKSNRNKVFVQGFILISLGIIYNLIFSYIESRNLIFWGWNILIFIGFAQIISYFIFKLVRWARLLIGLIIILITPYLRELLYVGKESSPIFFILHYIFVSPTPFYPLFPFASLWFFSTVFAELIYESTLLESVKANLHAAQSIIKYGIIFVIISFLYSLIQLFPFIEPLTYNPLKYPFIDLIPFLRGTSINYIPGMPEVLIKGTLQNIFLIIGTSLLIFSLIYYRIDIKRKGNKIYTILTIYGKNSITLLFLQWIFLPLFNQLLNFYLYLIISLIYLILVSYIIYFWQKYGKMKYSLEWFIRTESNHNNGKTI